MLSTVRVGFRGSIIAIPLVAQLEVDLLPYLPLLYPAVSFLPHRCRCCLCLGTCYGPRITKRQEMLGQSDPLRLGVERVVVEKMRERKP